MRVPGTEQTEGAIGLDHNGRIDLQLRIEALGNELGQVDGNIGPKTRQAIGVWQGKNGLPRTTYLTREQLAFLMVQTDPMMAAIRARRAADEARSARPPARPQRKVVRATTVPRIVEQKKGTARKGVEPVKRDSPRTPLFPATGGGSGGAGGSGGGSGSGSGGGGGGWSG
ncbi:peptidoglycan-binding domain-containing protein [Mesorhizobium sp.]|uniref:peptidoglycan-binding domain-containing protein n=1 Tax=Mesorhizobium sp. TaxID=1871066 RepID=UPI00257EBC01|nr:peptidoglycan-binding domain-containing protein [Mesorhizobium sp.]